MKWIFDGFGTEIIGIVITLIIGASAGGVVGYKIGINKNTISQSQKAKDYAKQKQVGEIKCISDSEKIEPDINIVKNKIKQSQKAGNKANQTQVGGVFRGR